MGLINWAEIDNMGSIWNEPKRCINMVGRFRKQIKSVDNINSKLCFSRFLNSTTTTNVTSFQNLKKKQEHEMWDIEKSLCKKKTLKLIKRWFALFLLRSKQFVDHHLKMKKWWWEHRSLKPSRSVLLSIRLENTLASLSSSPDQTHQNVKNNY